MDTRPERGSIPFDNIHLESSCELFAQLAYIQSECPVSWSTASGGFWMLTKHEDIVAASRDWETFTVTDGITIPAMDPTVSSIPAVLDPPRHTSFRKLLLPNFTEKSLQHWEPSLQRIVADSFASFLPSGRVDIVNDVALPIPVLTICSILGINRDWREVRRIAEEFVTAIGSESAHRSAEELSSFLREEIDARRGIPPTDLLGALVNAHIDDQDISEHEMLGMVHLLVVAGHETTMNAIGTLLYQVASQPELKSRILLDRSLAARAIDESLRLNPPIWNMARTVRQPTTVRNSELLGGEKVMLVYAAGNRDEEKFVNPMVFDIDRPGLTQHLTFGSGRHRCIGEALARLELKLTLDFVLDHIPDLELDEQPVFGVSMNGLGLRSLFVRFTPVH